MAEFLTSTESTGNQYVYALELDDGSVYYFDSYNAIEAAEKAQEAATEASAAAAEAAEAAKEAQAVITALSDEEINDICV